MVARLGCGSLGKQKRRRLTTLATAMEKRSKIPADARALLSDIAKIRQTILENAPECLAILAPTLVDAENRIYRIWDC